MVVLKVDLMVGWWVASMVDYLVYRSADPLADWMAAYLVVVMVGSLVA